MKKVLTIAGSDCSGGAGIQADLKTIAAHGLYGMSVITALTAQNTMGVTGIDNISKEFIEQQMDAVFEDIVPDGIKIGMVSNTDAIYAIAKKLREYNGKNIVVDPVMIATSGSKLLDTNAQKAIIRELFPLAIVITPNISEAEVIAGIKIETEEDMEKAAKIISGYNVKNILIKGGHLKDSANDLLYSKGNSIWFKSKRIDNDNTHGTGCTLSSSIACNLAEGFTIQESIKNAKEYITGAIADKLDLGKGHGPLNHMYKL